MACTLGSVLSDFIWFLVSMLNNLFCKNSVIFVCILISMAIKLTLIKLVNAYNNYSGYSLYILLKV